MANRIGLHSFFLDKEAWFNSPSSSYIPYEVPEGMTDTKRLVVYTVLTGDYDDVHEILYKEDGVDYLLFTNNPKISSNTWHVFLINEAMDNLFLSRKIKILPHQYLPTRYNRSIYIDANAVIYGELSQLAHYLDEQICFAVSRHHERNSVRDEVIALVDRGMIDQEEAAGQYSRYQSEGFSDQLGLAECSILVRNHQDNDLKDVMELWWEEFKRGVKRDQVSLLPCIQKRHFSGFVFMNGYVRHNQFCRIVSHKG